MKKVLRIILVLVLIFLFGGIGGVFFERFAVPQLLATPFFKKLGFLNSVTDRTTIINRTEQVIVQEDSSVEGVIAQPQTAVVTLSYPEQSSGRTMIEGQIRTGVLMTNDGVVATYLPEGGAQAIPEAIFSDGSHHVLTLLGYDRYTQMTFYKTKESTNTASMSVANSDDIHAGKKVIALKNTEKPAAADIFLSIIASHDYTFNLSGQAQGTSEIWEGVFSVAGLDGQKFQGAPVIGLTGEMVGLVGWLQQDEAVTSFLLPSNAVKAALDRAVTGSLSAVPTLGVHYRTVTPLEPASSGKITSGALVQAPLTTSSPALRAGLHVGDVITKIDDTIVTLEQPLPSILSTKSVGQTIVVTYVRAGIEQTVSVQLSL